VEPKFLRKGVERLEENPSKYLRGGVEGRGTPCSGDGATPLIRLVALSEAPSAIASPLGEEETMGLSSTSPTTYRQRNSRIRLCRGSSGDSNYP